MTRPHWQDCACREGQWCAHCWAPERAAVVVQVGPIGAEAIGEPADTWVPATQGEAA